LAELLEENAEKGEVLSQAREEEGQVYLRRQVFLASRMGR